MRRLQLLRWTGLQGAGQVLQGEPPEVRIVSIYIYIKRFKSVALSAIRCSNAF